MNHNFDFNKLFYEGLYFINKEDQKSIERTLQTKRIKDQFRTQALQTDKEYLAFKSRYYESVCEEIDRFIEDSQSDSKDLEITLFIKFIKVRVYKYFESVIQDKYPELTFEFQYDSEFMPERSQCMIKIHSQTNVEEPVESEKDESLKEEEGDYGFMDVIQELIDSEKPLITHNGFLDLLHLYNSFIGALPEDSEDFKREFLKSFPQIYDTKYLVNGASQLFSKTNQFTSLSDCFLESIELETPQIMIAEEFSAYKMPEVDGEEVEAAHEAGYDALMTGTIFLRYLEKLNFLEDFGTEFFNERIESYKNKVPLGGIKTPFNFENNLDYYSTPEETIFYCYSVNGDGQKMKDFITIVEKRFGELNPQMTFGENVEFFFNLIELEKMEELRDQLNKFGGSYICKCSLKAMSVNFEQIRMRNLACSSTCRRSKVTRGV